MRIIIAFVLLITSVLNATGQFKELKELPDNLLTTPVLLSMSLDDELFEETSKKIIADLKLLGIDVVTKINMDKNPTKALKQRDEFDNLMKEYKVQNVVGVNFLTFKFNKKTKYTNIAYIVEKEKAFITIMKSEDAGSRSPTLYMIKKNDYKKALDNLAKEIDKQF